MTTEFGRGQGLRLFQPAGYGRSARTVKRSIDVMGALFALTLAMPLLVLAIILIRLDTPGPAIFRQQRVGQFGTTFTLYKFRGMYVDAQERFPDLYRYRYTTEEAASLKFHPDADPRVTRVGSVLRRLSIDELPNLWNVLKGEMSLVGPRPEIPEMLPYYGGAGAVILSVKPGVTSLAKVSGRDQLTLLKTIEYELDYVWTRSTSLDMEILVRTAVTLLRDGWVIG